MKKYAYHKPSAESLKLIQNIREVFSNVETHLITDCPQSRELSIALTNLETAAMWAIKAVVVNDPESEVTI